jgi:hypothetical protein
MKHGTRLAHAPCCQRYSRRIETPDESANGDLMEICLIHFDGSRTANHALDSEMGRRARENTWLRDVTVIRRSARGRVSTSTAGSQKRNASGASRSRREPLRPGNDVAEPDLVDAWLPNAVELLTKTPARRTREAELERDVIRVVELEELVEPNSSALLLIADRSVCDDMEAMFARRSARTYRHDVLDDVARTLGQLLASSRGDAAPADD